MHGWRHIKLSTLQTHLNGVPARRQWRWGNRLENGALTLLAPSNRRYAYKLHHGSWVKPLKDKKSKCESEQ